MPGVGVDPTPFTAWGVLGLLGLVSVILVVVLYKLFSTQAAAQQARDAILMQFFDKNRVDFAGQAASLAQESRVSMQRIADTVVAGQDRLGLAFEKQAGTISAGYDRLVQAFEKQARTLDKVLLINSFMEHVERLKKSGVELSYEELQKAFQAVMRGRGGDD